MTSTDPDRDAVRNRISAFGKQVESTLPPDVAATAEEKFEKYKAKLDMSHFDPNALLRGLQLCAVATNRVLRNPELFTNEHYRQAGMAIAVGIVLQLMVILPSLFVRVAFWLSTYAYDFDHAAWASWGNSSLEFIQSHVLQVPFLVMTLLGTFTPALDNLFMESLKFVDQTNREIHPNSSYQMYHPALVSHASVPKPKVEKPNKLVQLAKRPVTNIVVYLLSLIPAIGALVLPAVSFWTFKAAVGVVPATVLFLISFLLPDSWSVVFLAAYYTSRNLTRALLEPYFSRMAFTPEQKRRWFRSREGLLFGFGLGFYCLIRAPYIGVLVYGIAQAATAYLVTKITDPPTETPDFEQSQVSWRNRHEFMNIPYDKVDAHLSYKAT